VTPLIPGSTWRDGGDRFQVNLEIATDDPASTSKEYVWIMLSTEQSDIFEEFGGNAMQLSCPKGVRSSKFGNFIGIFQMVPLVREGNIILPLR